PRRAFSPVVSVSSTICLAAKTDALGNAFIRERVGALVFRMPRVAFHPMPFHVMTLRHRVQPAPQVFVLDGLLVRGLPAAALPGMNPFRDALLHILRVRVDKHQRALL